MAEEVKQPKKDKKSKTDKSGRNQELAVDEIHLKQTYEWYCIWRSLPPMMIHATEKGKKLSPQAICEKFGIDDELLIELIEIKTQTEFCARYEVNKDTLTRWNKLISSRDVLADIRKWAIRLSKNVMTSLYQNAMKSGGATFKDRENYFKIVNQWNEKLNVEHNVGESLFDILSHALPHDNNGRK